MTDLLYVPNSEEDALKFNSDILDALSADNPLWLKALGILPTVWIQNAIYEHKWKKNFLLTYNNLDMDGGYHMELPSDINLYTINHLFIDELNKKHEEDFFKQNFLSPILPRSLYLFHPIYELYVLKERYFETIFSEKLFFLKKILVGLGASSINISMASLESEKMSSVFSIGLSNDRYNLKSTQLSETENVSFKKSKSIFYHPNNIPNEEYSSLEEDDFDEDGNYLFLYEKNEINSYKMYCWVYNDDKEFQHIFETRLKQIRENKLSELKFSLSCKFKDISIKKTEEEILISLGLIGSNQFFSEIDKTQVALNLEVEFGKKELEIKDASYSKKQDKEVEFNPKEEILSIDEKLIAQKPITPQNPISEKQAKKIKELKKAHERGFLSDEQLEKEIQKLLSR